MATEFGDYNEEWLRFASGSHRIVEEDAKTGDESYGMESSALLVGTSGVRTAFLELVLLGREHHALVWVGLPRHGRQPPMGQVPISDRQIRRMSFFFDRKYGAPRG